MLPARTSIFSDLDCEHGFLPLRVEGRIPQDLRGILYRNGAARFTLKHHRFTHWFDGHGAVTAIRIGGGRAEGAVRLVRGPTLIEEELTGRPQMAGLAEPPASKLCHLTRLLLNRPLVRNPANTSVLYHRQRLFALCEAGLPVELTPRDLRTLGETDLGGVIPFSFSAHPHEVPARRTVYNFGVRYGQTTLLDLFALPQDGPARRLQTLPLRRPTLLHDFIATPRHLVFLCPPLRPQMLRVLLGLSPFVQSLSWQPHEGTEVLIVPIDAPDRPIRFQAEPFFQWHFANAFERGGDLIVDLVRYPDFASNDWLTQVYSDGQARIAASGRLYRLVISPERRQLRADPLWDGPCEVPQVARADRGQPYRHAYLCSHSREALHGLWDQVARVDLETGQAVTMSPGPAQHPSEPIFVPKARPAGPDDGYLLSLVYDARAHRSHLLGLDARDLQRGPLFRAHFDHHIPMPFHGPFVAE